ncbi:hypothetical protein HK405_011183, partial [Cladochytrium tenue]
LVAAAAAAAAGEVNGRFDPVAPGNKSEDLVPLALRICGAACTRREALLLLLASMLNPKEPVNAVGFHAHVTANPDVEQVLSTGSESRRRGYAKATFATSSRSRLRRPWLARTRWLWRGCWLAVTSVALPVATFADAAGHALYGLGLPYPPSGSTIATAAVASLPFVAYHNGFSSAEASAAAAAAGTCLPPAIGPATAPTDYHSATGLGAPSR